MCLTIVGNLSLLELLACSHRNFYRLFSTNICRPLESCQDRVGEMLPFAVKPAVRCGRECEDVTEAHQQGTHEPHPPDKAKMGRCLPLRD